MSFPRTFKYCIQSLSKYVPFSSTLKKYLLKLLLNDQEKQFFSLVAPEDSVGTKAARGYLMQTGWYDSLHQDVFQDREGNPIPWLTYPAIALLKQRLKPDLFVLEYGSGSSTLFFAQRVKELYSIEHHPDWYNRIKTQSPENAHLFLTELNYGGDYHKLAVSLGKFHIILIDGRDRVNCCRLAPQILYPSGVIILDDSERSGYQHGIQYLLDQKFRQLPFHGLKPRSTQESCTTIFYKPGNCLNI